jgi:hypothetical protein
MILLLAVYPHVASWRLVAFLLQYLYSHAMEALRAAGLEFLNNRTTYTGLKNSPSFLFIDMLLRKYLRVDSQT